MIDLEHESLGMPARPDSRDARGWAQLEMRKGELWAVNVRWTPDGERRLREKTQRYLSPAFERDPATGRILSLVNIALTAIPATYDAPALVAASARGLGRRNSSTIGIRMQAALRDLVAKEAQRRGITAGEFVREAVLRGLGVTEVEARACERRGVSVLEFAERKATQRTAEAQKHREATRQRASAPVVTISDREREQCRRRGIDVQDFAARKSRAGKRG